MFNQRTDIALEGPNPFVRKIGNRFFHKDQIPRALRFNDQRRDREVLDNLRAQGVPVGPVVPIAEESNKNHIGKKGGAKQKQLAAQQGPVVPAQYLGAQGYPEAQFGGYPTSAIGNPYQQPYAPTVSGLPLGNFPAYGYAAGAPFGYNANPIAAPGVYSPTIVGAPGFGALY